MAEDEDLQLLRATRPRQQPHQGEQVPHDEIDQRPEQCSPPSTTTKSGEPSEPDARTAAERVCEPYARTCPQDLSPRAARSGDQFEGRCVTWSDDAEVPAVKCRDRGDAEAFRDNDQAGVGAAEAEVGVSLDQFRDSPCVCGRDRLDL